MRKYILILALACAAVGQSVVVAPDKASLIISTVNTNTTKVTKQQLKMAEAQLQSEIGKLQVQLKEVQSYLALADQFQLTEQVIMPMNQTNQPVTTGSVNTNAPPAPKK